MWRHGRIYELQQTLERRALDTALDLARPDREDRVLDVATGTGALLRRLAHSDVRPREAVGLDASPQMLALARRRLPPGWRLLGGDAGRLPFAEHSFDLVTACYLLHLLGAGERAKVTSEIARVLRPGGRAVLVTVAARRPRARAVLERLPATSGLHPLDPTGELTAVGLRPLRARFVHGGWPSLCVLARREGGAL